MLAGFHIVLVAGMLGWIVFLFPRLAPALWGLRFFWGLWLILVVVISIQGVAWPWRRKKAGEVLLDLGRLETGLMRWVDPLFFLAGLMLLWPPWRRTENLTVSDFAMGAFCLGAGIYHFSLSCRRTLVTDRGILVDALAEWNGFETWAWEGKDGCTLKLFPKENPDSFWWGLGYRRLPLKLKLSAGMKEPMTTILAARLSAEHNAEPAT